MYSRLEDIGKEVQECRKCSLWKNRSKAVFGEGPNDAEVMLIGLGPGYNENAEGRPFVGPAGKLLDHLMKLAGINREDVYITNITKCYLPENKATEEQINSCTPYLDRQIDILEPKIIILLGNVAVKCIFSKFKLGIDSMSSLHGKIFSISTLVKCSKIIPMYHPAAALRNPGLRSMLENDWEDLESLIFKRG